MLPMLHLRVVETLTLTGADLCTSKAYDRIHVKCKYETRNTGNGPKNEENTDSYETLRRNSYDSVIRGENATGAKGGRPALGEHREERELGRWKSQGRPARQYSYHAYQLLPLPPIDIDWRINDLHRISICYSRKTRAFVKVFIFLAKADPRGDQGLHSSKNSTRSPREITLNLLLYLIVQKPHLLWFHWISFDYRVTLDFGSIAGGLDHVNPVIRLPIEHGINR
ncbi:hypothetical protein Tco_0766427, partial [Tanacetum coccineum]